MEIYSTKHEKQQSFYISKCNIIVSLYYALFSIGICKDQVECYCLSSFEIFKLALNFNQAQHKLNIK